MGTRLERFVDYVGGRRRQERKARQAKVGDVLEVIHVVATVSRKVRDVKTFLREDDGPLGLGVIPAILER